MRHDSVAGLAGAIARRIGGAVRDEDLIAGAKSEFEARPTLTIAAGRSPAAGELTETQDIRL